MDNDIKTKALMLMAVSFSISVGAMVSDALDRNNAEIPMKDDMEERYANLFTVASNNIMHDASLALGFDKNDAKEIGDYFESELDSIVNKALQKEIPNDKS